MTALAQHAAELDALVRDGRRIRLGDRQFERPHADLEELLSNLQGLADRMRAEAGRPQAFTVTGRGQVLVAVARSAPKPSNDPRPGLRVLKAVPGGRP